MPALPYSYASLVVTECEHRLTLVHVLVKLFTLNTVDISMLKVLSNKAVSDGSVSNIRYFTVAS